MNKERENVQTDLNVATGPANLKKNAKVLMEIQALMKHHASIKNNIKQDKLTIANLDLQIKDTKQRIAEMKKKVVSDVQVQNRVMEGRNTLEKLENKLCTINRSFGAIQAENMVLKEEIDHYLKERWVFLED